MYAISVQSTSTPNRRLTNRNSAKSPRLEATVEKSAKSSGSIEHINAQSSPNNSIDNDNVPSKRFDTGSDLSIFVDNSAYRHVNFNFSGSSSSSGSSSGSNNDNNNNNNLDVKVNEYNESNDDESFVEMITSSIPFHTLSIYFAWVLIGLLWYKYYNKWTWATAFYYTLEAGLSIGFCNPVEKDDGSKLFTVFFVLVGSSIISGAVGCFTSYLFLHKQVFFHTNTPVSSLYDENNKITLTSVFRHYYLQLKIMAGWYSNRRRAKMVFILLGWISVGCVYCMLQEEWSFITSLYWSVTSLSTGGLQSPVCLNAGNDNNGKDCDIGAFRASIMGMYFLIGVPIYFMTMGQFAGMGIQYVTHKFNKKLLKRPIETDEFLYAANILSQQGSSTLVLGEYILLELIRLGLTTPEQIDEIKMRFKDLDDKNEGELSLKTLKDNGAVIQSKHPVFLPSMLNYPVDVLQMLSSRFSATYSDDNEKYSVVNKDNASINNDYDKTNITDI